MVKGESNMTYATVRLPESLTNEIDRVLRAEFLGYQSRAEFVAEAIREKICNLKSIIRDGDGVE